MYIYASHILQYYVLTHVLLTWKLLWRPDVQVRLVVLIRLRNPSPHTSFSADGEAGRPSRIQDSVGSDPVPFIQYGRPNSHSATEQDTHSGKFSEKLYTF